LGGGDDTTTFALQNGNGIHLVFLQPREL
jgi:hypothetical protein